MSLRKQAKILDIAPSYLSMLINGKREWPHALRDRYEELVNTTAGAGEKQEDTNLEFVFGKELGGATGTRTLCLFNVILQRDLYPLNRRHFIAIVS